MSKAKRISAATLSAAMTLAATQVTAQEPTADMRSAARSITALERPLEKRDIKGYCTAVQADPEYTVYVTRACQSYVKNNLKKPEECSDANIKQEIKKDLDRCLAMTSDDMDKTVQSWRDARASFVKDMKAKGIDAEKLIAEERAKRR